MVPQSGSAVAEAQAVGVVTGEHRERLQRQQREHFMRSAPRRPLACRSGEAVGGGCDLRRRHRRARSFWRFGEAFAALRHEPDCITSWGGSRCRWGASEPPRIGECEKARGPRAARRAGRRPRNGRYSQAFGPEKQARAACDPSYRRALRRVDVQREGLRRIVVARA